MKKFNLSLIFSALIGCIAGPAIANTSVLEGTNPSIRKIIDGVSATCLDSVDKYNSQYQTYRLDRVSLQGKGSEKTLQFKVQFLSCEQLGEEEYGLVPVDPNRAFRFQILQSEKSAEAQEPVFHETIVQQVDVEGVVFRPSSSASASGNVIESDSDTIMVFEVKLLDILNSADVEKYTEEGVVKADLEFFSKEKL